MRTISLADDNRSAIHAINRITLLTAIVFFWIFCAAAHAAQVTLEWEPGDDAASIAGYKVYYGTSSGRYSHVLNIGEYTSCDISGLVKGERYYFAATSYDTEGNESDKSSEISYIAGSQSVDPGKRKQIAAAMAVVNRLLLE